MTRTGLAAPKTSTNRPLYSDDSTPSAGISRRRLVRLLVMMAGVLFVTELAVMCFLPLLGLEGMVENVADSALLAILALPALYLIGIRSPALADRIELQRYARIEKQTLLVLFGQVATVALIIIIDAVVVTGQEDNARVINVAGRQRMLSQRLVKAAILDHVESTERTVKQDGSSRSQEIAEYSGQFEKSLQGLMHGDDELGLPACSSKPALQQLEKVDETWQALQALLSRGPDDSGAPRRVLHHEKLNQAGDRLLAEMEQGVALLETYYSKQSRTLDALLGLSITAAGLVSILLVIEFLRMLRHRKKLDAMLIDREARTRAILNTAADGIITIDGRGIIESFNGAAEQMFGYASEEVIGRSVNILMPTPYKEQHDEHMRRYLDTAESKVVGKSLEVIGLRKDGSTFPMSLHVSELKAGDRRLFTGITRDITRRKRAEEALVKSESELKQHVADLAKAHDEVEQINKKLSQNHEEMEEFLHIITHDLKHPLISLAGLLRSARRDLNGLGGPEVDKVLQSSLAECRRMQDMIVQLFELSQIDRQGIVTKAADLQPWITSIVQRFAERAAAQHVRLEVASDDVRVVVAQAHLQEALDNLIENALKYGCSRPDPCIQVDCRVQDSSLVVTVRDNGNGIAPKHHESVFEVFRRLNPNNEDGSGVGLTAVRRRIERAGGSVSLESEVGQGASFAIHIPVLIERTARAAQLCGGL